MRKSDFFLSGQVLNEINHSHRSLISLVTWERGRYIGISSIGIYNKTV